MKILKWIEQWYKEQCDGDWEHDYSIKISTIDNPGWQIEIDLKGTQLEELEKEWELIENDESDWYGIKIKNSKFSAAGDTQKLEFLLKKFREIIEEK